MYFGTDHVIRHLPLLTAYKSFMVIYVEKILFVLVIQSTGALLCLLLVEFEVTMNLGHKFLSSRDLSIQIIQLISWFVQFCSPGCNRANIMLGMWECNCQFLIIYNSSFLYYSLDQDSYMQRSQQMNICWSLEVVLVHIKHQIHFWLTLMLVTSGFDSYLRVSKILFFK